MSALRDLIPRWRPRAFLVLVVLPLPIAWLVFVAAVGLWRSVAENDPDAFVVGSFAGIAAGTLVYFGYRVML